MEGENQLKVRLPSKEKVEWKNLLVSWVRLQTYAITTARDYRPDIGSWQTYSGELKYLDMSNPNAMSSLQLSGHGTAHKGYRDVGV